MLHAYLLALFPLLLCLGPVVGHAAPASELFDAPARGQLLSATRLAALSAAQLNGRFNVNRSAKNGVTIYRVVYQTETPDRTPRPIQASGIIIVPDTGAAAFPWISLQHGTIVGEADAPSASPSEGLYEGSQGYVTVVMDYLGFGAAGEVFHPYVIEEAYADAGVDMLRAARQFASSKSIGLGPLFLKGYSEGGYATMALQKALETRHQNEFVPVASAPAAGPYDVEATAKVLLRGRTNNQVNVPFVVLSYTKWLAQADFDPARVFNVDMERVWPLFSGSFRNADVYRALPNVTTELLRPAIVRDFALDQPQLPENQTLIGWFRQQSLHNKGWTPRTPTRLYHCQDDEAVPVEAALSAYSSFKAANRAANVETVIITSPNARDPYRHTNCPAISASLQWFAEILAASGS